MGPTERAKHRFHSGRRKFTVTGDGVEANNRSQNGFTGGGGFFSLWGWRPGRRSETDRRGCESCSGADRKAASCGSRAELGYRGQGVEGKVDGVARGKDGRQWRQLPKLELCWCLRKRRKVSDLLCSACSATNPTGRFWRSGADERNNGIFLGAPLRPSTPGQCEKSETERHSGLLREPVRGARGRLRADCSAGCTVVLD